MRKKFSLSDIRTVQDWIVRKQFAGTEGVAEVNGWGGYVKQYEVAINPDRLASFGLTVVDLYKAIEGNNENTGGSYIEQGNNQYFIRGIGLARTLDDIRQIPVKTVNSIPVLVSDVAEVRYGSAMRYGAVTRNGEGEVVSGITLMLKGENFQQVIKNVKERMNQVQKSLPKGLVIEPFIDRTQLVDRVTFTITENLVLGLLIVIFVLMLFFGQYPSRISGSIGHSACHALCFRYDEGFRCRRQLDESWCARLWNYCRWCSHHRGVYHHLYSLSWQEC